MNIKNLILESILNEAKTEVITYKGASAKLVFEKPGFALLTSVKSDIKGKGHAEELMRVISDYADKHKLNLRLNVLPDDDDTDWDRLAGLYKKHGFEHNPTSRAQMTRKQKS